MAEENVNNNVPETGDVLGQVPGSVSEPRSLKDISRAVANIDSTTQQLNRNFMRFISDNSRTSTGNFAARFEDESYNRKQSSRASSSTSRSSFSSSVKHKSSGALDDFLNGFEEQLSEYLGIPYLGDNIDEMRDRLMDNLKHNLSSALGVNKDALFKELGKAVTQLGLDKFSLENPKLSQAFKQSAKGFVDNFKTAASNAAQSWNDYMYDNMPGKRADKFSVDTLFADPVYEAEKSNSVSASGSKISSQANRLDKLYVNTLLVGRQSSDSSAVAEALSDTAGMLVDSKGNPLSSASKGVVDEAVSAAADTVGKSVTSAIVSSDVSVLIGGLQSAASSLVAVGPQIAAVLAAMVVLDVLSDTLGKFVTQFGDGWKKLTSGFNKVDEMRWANVEAQEERMLKDVQTFVEHPFQVLEDAANKVYEVWDSALQTITATQGYDKSGLQDLMSAYAQRLREEGLSDVVGTTDVTSMLQQILNAGLSGAVAEEFAYQATVLNKAIPTEDFTSYAASYASLVSSYMSLGYTQTEALEYANQQLKVFASNVLTASREVSGGLTTSLTGVADLFNEIVKISQTAGTSDTSKLSSALSIVQAVAGQVSPDVGNQLVSQIVEAAVGGNDSSLVALRSLAGSNASNTAFLRQLASNPDQVLANLFSGLSEMFDKSTDNYMEVAYSLSETFGVSADALARIDWNRLVEELRTNSSNTSALNQNMSLLQSGETTTSAESQRIAQINQYMIEEGLSYVLDNEAARSIQEHMWQQEIAAEMKEATYAVDFAGGALEIFTSIQSLIQNIANVLTFGLANLGQVVDSGLDYAKLTADIGNMLEAGKVGNGNTGAYHDLTTYDVNALTYKPNEMDLWDKYSWYGGLIDFAANNISTSLYTGADMPDSKYSWGSSGKSVLDTFSNYSPTDSLVSSVVQSASSAIQESTNSQLSSWISTMSNFIGDGLSFADWYATASDYGFSDVSSALEQAGYTQSDLENAYLTSASNQAAQIAAQRSVVEQQFYQEGTTWLTQTYPTDKEAWNVKYDTAVANWNTKYDTKTAEWATLYSNTVQSFTEHLDLQMLTWQEMYVEYTEQTQKLIRQGNESFDENFVNGFLYDWRDYYIGNHTHYREATNFDSSLRTINSEKSQTGEAVLALAQTLTKNYEDLADPQVQTNVLLGQIVIILQAMLTAQQSGKGLTLPTSLASLGLNITNPKESK